MAIFHESIPKAQIEWILAQKVFWVATAPLSKDGNVNVSPKGGPYFGIPDERTFWYMDLSGSGIETISHLHEKGNGRITIMFSAFEGPPKIFRLWGKGRVIENGTKEFQDFITKHSITTIPGSRSIIVVDVHQAGSSCGFSVPFYEFKEHRTVLNDFFSNREKRFKEGKKEESIDRYWAYKNAWSMDGLPGLERALVTGKVEHVEPIKKMVGPHAPTRYYAPATYGLKQLMFVAVICLLLGAALVQYRIEYSGWVTERIQQLVGFLNPEEMVRP
ncbi:hypothetical protein EJ08DRAFT_693988 [Tothia fuscella]|uniref:Pyridoxamine 5'-phosphate oxidase N-terminal domain-containing protein n=1 Tax=Tothia fuscella TaxID=1048955 RepID=A0A9P4U1X2_9PEZI|nr:hypothetical protein EJ08DRAFT_693988 [Tothia fuscella]